MLNTAEIIKAMRAQKGWSIRQLARESGTSSATIYHLEHNNHQCTLWTFESLLDSMGYRLEIVENE